MHRLRPFICLICGLFPFLPLTFSPLQAAPPANWEVMRVFIRDQPNQISRLVTRHYATVLLDDLSRELAEHDNLQKIAALNAPGLQDALYVARLEGELIVSDLSRWQLSGIEFAQPLELGNISLALRAARGLSNGQSQLLDHVQFSATGGVEIQPLPTSNEHWFGFSVSGQLATNQRTFSFRVPAALNAKMYVATTANADLSSPETVVQKLDSPPSELPQGWPAGALTASGGAIQWWLVHLSGVSQFQLVTSENTSASLTAFHHLVRTANLDYLGRDQQLSMHANFVVAGTSEPATFRLRLSPEFKIESVAVDDVAVNWLVLPSIDANSNRIELLNVPHSVQDRRIEVQATSLIDVSHEVALPTLSIESSFTKEGTCRLSGEGDVVADRLQSGDATVQRIARKVPTVDTANSPLGLDRALWQTNWLGQPPPMIASFSRLRHPWNASSLTRLSMQAEWLSANCRMRLDSSQLKSNEIRLPIGSGWFIDAVRLIQSGTDFRARVEESKDAANPVIVIYWDNDRDHIDVELEVVAHSPQEPSAETIHLQFPRLVTVPWADQIDNYVIEPSSRFAVQLDADLLAYQRSVADLPAWQQLLLAEQPEQWIFQPVRGVIPQITLTASNGTFSSHVATVVRHEGDSIDLETHVTITPMGGAIDRVNLLLPDHATIKRSHWKLQQAAAETVGLSGANAANQSIVLPQSLSVSQTGSSADNNGSLYDSQIIELELPSAISEPFTLTSHAQIALANSDSPLSLPIVGVPQATDVESIVVLPKQMASHLDGQTELLPAVPSQGTESLAKLLGAQFPQPSSDWVVARVESGAGQRLQVTPPSSTVHPNWAWSEWLQHSILEDGTMRHEVQWLIESTKPETIEVRLPSDWHVDQVTLNGELVSCSTDVSRVLLDLPQMANARVTLHCTSRQGALGWINHSSMARPRLSMPVLESRQTVDLPPSRAIFPNFPFPSTNVNVTNRLLDRVLPSAAWKLLAPSLQRDGYKPNFSTELHDDRMAGLPPDWQRLEIVELGEPISNDSGIWTISRSALASFCLATVVFVATVFWIVFADNVRRWWIMVAACTVVLVLVPLWLLPVVQLVSLSVMLAAFMRLGRIVCRLPDRAAAIRGRSSVVSGLSGSPTTSLLLTLVLCASAYAQSGSPNAPNSRPAPSSSSEQSFTRPVLPGSATTSQGEDDHEIFSVLIPIDEAGQVSGAYAYAPTRLLELLAGSGEAASSAESPRVLSADYTLRMRRSLLGQPDQLQELSVDFRLQVSQADMEIRLPFNRSQLLLQRGSAGGELFVGGRGLNQVNDAVVFRPNSAGAVRLQLQFEVRNVTQSNNQANLRCQIPPIPNATLSIEGNSNSSFEVRAAGTGRKSLVPGATDLLGPVDTLDLQWSLNKPRSALGQTAAEVHADTWLYGRGNQIVAICQLRIDQARSLPRELHLVSEPDWEPVGVNWQDGELVANELSSLGGRRVYTLRCGEDWDSQPSRTLRVLMVPRKSDNDDGSDIGLSIPFFTLREVSQQAVTRTLAWSAESDAVWRPEGLSTWQELPSVAGLDWGGLGWSGQPRLYRIVNTLNASLRRAAPTRGDRVDEVTEVHLGEHEATITYRAQLALPNHGVLGLLLPADARVLAVRIDDSSANYRVSQRAEHALIELLPRPNGNGARTIEVELSQSTKLGQRTSLPRVVLRGYEASSSVIRLLRATGLDCQVESSPTVQLRMSTLPPHQLLPRLELPVGEIELRNAYRDHPLLPLTFQLQAHPDPPMLGSVMVLQPSDQGWKATLRTTWRSEEQPLDFAFFELPVTVRDSIDAKSLPSQLVPSGDPSRLTLRILPPPPVSGLTTVEFGFMLPKGGATQTLNIPLVKVLLNQAVNPIVALPRQIDGQVVAWSQTGRLLTDVADGLLPPNWQQSHQFYEFETPQSQVGWKRFEDAPQESQLLLSQTTLLKHEGQWISGFVDYWVQPNTRLNFDLSLSETCDVLGVEIGGHSAVWSRNGQKLSVLMQPNFLPLNLRVLLHWRVDNLRHISVTLPRALNTTRVPGTLQYLANQLSEQRVEIDGPMTVSVSLDSQLAQHWGKLIADTWPAVSSRPPDQTRAWLLQWHPGLLGIDDDVAIDSILSPEELSELGVEQTNAPDVMTIASLWQQLWLQSNMRLLDDNNREPDNTFADDSRDPEVASAAAMLLALADRQPPGARRPSRQLLSFGNARVDNDNPQVIELHTPPMVSSWTAQWSAAGLLAIAAALAYFVAVRFSTAYLKLLAAHPWIYWLQLAGVAWFLLPAVWPSCVLALTALAMFVSHSLEARRRHRMLARV